MSEKELVSAAAKYSGNVMFIHTDKFGCRRFGGEIPDVPHLLEIRIFSEDKEFKAARSDISRDFVWRELDDSSGYDGHYDEEQYLDIASSSGNIYTFIGGGEYEMPEPELSKAVIRHYFKYDEDGIEQVLDERILRFMKKEGC